MREIVLDTETTGLDPNDGHRIVEIGAVELLNHLPTGRVYHQYVNPERDMPLEAFEVHGIGSDMLADKPVFRAIGGAFLAFCGDARLVIHNASFDIKFLNAELRQAGLAVLEWGRVVDTLAIARRKYPGSPASLDALCRRFGIDNSVREKHGALLDSEILAEVYLELIGGRQPGLVLESVKGGRAGMEEAAGAWRARPRAQALSPRLSAEEANAHRAFVDTLGDAPVWSRYSEFRSSTGSP